MNVTPRALEYGIYRDGDNNLDREQAATLTQAMLLSSRDSALEIVVEDTTSRRGLKPEGVLRTERYVLRDGAASEVEVRAPDDMSKRSTLAAFVARTLERAHENDAKQTWIELVDHGGGDGGGLESAAHGTMMSERAIAGAIADGVAKHASAHPDSPRSIDGVVANQCLMSTLGFADALSRVGVKYLAASPEVMLAPGVPTTVAHAIAHDDDPKRMARSVVAQTMNAQYPSGEGPYTATAAFNVLDISPQKVDAVREHVGALNRTILAATHDDPRVAEHIRADERSVPGMARFTRESMPWHADRPAIALYETFARNELLPQAVRSAARTAAAAVRDMVLAHKESGAYEPFGGRDYRDAVGPTVHAPVSRAQIDPWAPEVRETANAFWRDTAGDRVARALT